MWGWGCMWGGGRAARDDFVLCHGQRAACMACVWEFHWHCPCADNGLGSEGGIAFAEALKTNTSLSSLNLWGMPVLHHVPTQHMCAPQCARPCLRTFAVVSEGPVDRLRWICGIHFFTRVHASICECRGDHAFVMCSAPCGGLRDLVCVASHIRGAVHFVCGGGGGGAVQRRHSSPRTDWGPEPRKQVPPGV